MILVFGCSGQVASALQRLDPSARFLSRQDVDLADPQSCGAAIKSLAPQAVINAAAYTAVDKAEEDAELAFRINAEAPGAMAAACTDLAIPLIHISTDYVFDGSGDHPWAPDDPALPINAYGRSKKAGEEAVRSTRAVHAILRTSWVFSATGSNFLKTMLRLGSTRPELRIVEDQIGGPTPAHALAQACLRMAHTLIDEPGRMGTYHFSGMPNVSWKSFAEAIFAASGHRVRVEGIPTSDYPTPARRPLNSRLDCLTTEAVFGLRQPDWGAALPGLLADLGATQP